MVGVKERQRRTGRWIERDMGMGNGGRKQKSQNAWDKNNNKKLQDEQDEQSYDLKQLEDSDEIQHGGWREALWRCSHGVSFHVPAVQAGSVMRERTTRPLPAREREKAVSYTHLTLPTSDLV